MGDVILDFCCAPGKDHREHTISMKLSDALRLCEVTGKGNKNNNGLIGLEIKI